MPRESNSDNKSSTYNLLERPYKDKETLQELYHEKNLTQEEIADQFSVEQPTISRWIREHNLEKESQSIHRTVHRDGKVQLFDEGEHLVYCHQVVALEEYSLNEVFDPSNDVHHLIGGPVAVDLPENLTVLSHSEHRKRHIEGTATDHPEIVLRHTFDEFRPDIGSVDDVAPDFEGTSAD